MSNSLVGVDDRSRRSLEQKLASWWCTVLGIPQIGIDDDVFRLGCDPERGAIVLNQVRHELSVEIPTSDLFEARTISKLADMIEIRQASMDAHSIIPIRQGGGKQPLFLVHGVGGNLLGFINLVRSLDSDQPVYGIQAQALQTSGPILIQLEAMAAYYIRELKLIQPTGPYAFLGLSFGGLVAYEMAQQLVARGETVNLLAMLDTWQPGYMRQIKRSGFLPSRILNRLRVVALNTQKLSVRQTIRYALGRFKGRALRLMYLRIGNSHGVTLPGSMRRVRDINLMAGARYVVRPYAGAITLFRALYGDTSLLPEDLGWSAYARQGVDIVKLPGDHGQVLAEPNVSHLARALTACMNRNHAASSVTLERTDFELHDTEEPLNAPTAAPLAHEATDDQWQSGRILVDHMTAIPEPRNGILAMQGLHQARKAAD